MCRALQGRQVNNSDACSISALGDWFSLLVSEHARTRPNVSVSYSQPQVFVAMFFVPDFAKGTLAGGWGMSQRGGGWATASVGDVLDQHVPTAATTSFTLAFDWQGMLSRIEGILPP